MKLEEQCLPTSVVLFNAVHDASNFKACWLLDLGSDASLETLGRNEIYFSLSPLCRIENRKDRQ